METKYSLSLILTMYFHSPLAELRVKMFKRLPEISREISPLSPIPMADA